MEKDTIIEVVNKLTGECYPYGSESVDGDRYNNLLLKQWVVDELMRDILDAGKLYNRHEYSILRISNKANQWLTEWRDILNYIEYLPPNPELQEELQENLHREKEQAYMQGYEDGAQHGRQI